MSHEIDTLAYSERGGSVWHGLGVPLDDSVDARTMIEQAGLDWQVEPVKLYTRKVRAINEQPLTGSSDRDGLHWFTPLLDTKAMIRSDTGAVLGTVSDGYQAIQNQ